MLADHSADVLDVVGSLPIEKEGLAVADDATTTDDVAGEAAVVASGDDDEQDADVSVPGVSE